jgi:hypothetical protein
VHCCVTSLFAEQKLDFSFEGWSVDIWTRYPFGRLKELGLVNGMAPRINDGDIMGYESDSVYGSGPAGSLLDHGIYDGLAQLDGKILSFVLIKSIRMMSRTRSTRHITLKQNTQSPIGHFPCAVEVQCSKYQ